MIRLKIFVFTVILLIAGFNAGEWGSSASAQEPPELTRDGRTNSASIPDYVAYEFFFKSLITSPAEGDRGQRRVISFTKQAGVADADAGALLGYAQEFYQRVAGFDRRVKGIKDHNWPNPGPDVWNQLKKIQQDKEAAILDGAESILTRLGKESGEKLRAFINAHVKHGIKGFADKPNPGQVMRPNLTIGKRLATFFSPLYSSVMQMQGEETVYIYANASHTPGSDIVYGYGDVTATASSYGHEYSARSELYGPCGQLYSLDGGFLAMPIELCDGVYNFYCFAVQSCPIANTIRDSGSAENNVNVGPFFSIGEFSAFNPVAVRLGQPSSISTTISASQSVPSGASVDITFGYNATPQFSMNVTITGSETYFLNAGQTRAASATYTPTALAAGANSANLTAVATINSRTTGVTVINSPKSSSTTLGITR
jgi:hypothetical protein